MNNGFASDLFEIKRMLNEIIWNNNFICIGGKPLFMKTIA